MQIMFYLLLLQPFAWDNTISAGNVITITLVIIGFVAAWTKLGDRVNNIDKWVTQHETEVAEREKVSKELNENFHALDKSLGLLKQSLDGVCDRLARIENGEREQWNEHRRRMEQERRKRG